MSSSSISSSPCLSIVSSHTSSLDCLQSTSKCAALPSAQQRSTNEVALARIEAIVVSLMDDSERIKKSEEIKNDFKVAVFSGNSKRIRELVASPLFKEISREDFEKALIQGLKISSPEECVGRLEIVKALLLSHRWQEVSHEVLERALFLLASHEESELIGTIFQSLPLEKKDNANLAAATLFLGQSLGYHEVVKVIKSIDPYIEITSTIARDVFIKLARQGHAKIVKAIIQSDLFKEVNEDSLNQAFFEGSLNSRWKVMRLILAARRFGGVSEDTIYKSCFLGRFFFSKEIVSAMSAKRQVTGEKKEALTPNPKVWKALILVNQFGELYELRRDR